ncbi:phage tail assembly chaperone [Aeromonas veronii]|uniref:phage tail assembly chaperone n=1 Tax=Aeromonas veronii TaxID=654 RepID=UPI0029370299|nr:phage tail assembly chaperone [Aeromonas veronii]WOE85857.1 phage tail assembly chaperone [Aeromonas veronii]
MNNIDWSKKITPAIRAAERESALRNKRDEELKKSGWLIERHRDELEHLSTTTLSAEQYAELQTYRHQLRDWPAQPGWPDIDMPPEPDWLTELKK